VKRPAFWVLFAVLSAAAGAVAWHYFPQAFSIVSLEITMDRDAALREAGAIMARDHLGPAGYRQAASFTLDDETQTFVELEGGGKEAFTRMMREGFYSAYTWRVRQFREGDPNETLIRFTPNGTPYGFVERLKEDAPGATLDAAEARRRAEAEATARWRVDLGPYTLVEQGQERRTGGRVDHTFTYERGAPTLNEGRYRLRLVVGGDRLTEVTHLVRIPEAFTRRYQNMRSANEAIGMGSAVGMVLLYVVGGIGIGLFYMLRGRWVLWRRAAFWGAAVGIAQALATANEWPLMWMAYDTALPRATFMAQQVATLVAMLVGFSLFFALSFMAAETLTRRAFGSHPQFWRVWEKGPGSSTTIAGHTVAGYLLVTIFFAYDVLLYLYATRTLGWWAPSEALLHPDVLATYLPWLSAIANSFQAGFWEECLFRAVPIAGAALIGDRFGKRRLFIVAAFVIQAVVFGAGHAPYPTQPSYARPVELIIPSIGFGLLYLYFGLLPGIVLHFAFDVVWFALPIFIASAPGIWIHQAMVIVLTLVPLGVVLWRRIQVGRWTTLAPADRNRAWTPPAAVERPAAVEVAGDYAISPRVRAAWLALGAAGLVACAVAMATREAVGSLSISRAQAADIGRQALEARGVALGPHWRVMAMPDNGEGGPHEFVAETAGEARRRELTGVYLPATRWIVRVATFEGDVAERAEEWQVFVSDTGAVRRVQHTLPEARPGAALDESAARTLAGAALRDTFQLDTAAGQAREISARPAKLSARTDWTFTFVDTSVAPLPKGEPRIEIRVAGDEIASTARFVYVPEDWERAQRAARTRSLVLQIVGGLLLGGILVAAAVTGVIAWSRRRFSPRLFLAASGLVFVALLVNGVNGWPSMLAQLQTALPLQIQMIGVIGIGLVVLTINSALVGLAIGALPRRLAGAARMPEGDALRLGIALGCLAGGVAVATAALRPAWATLPTVSPLGTFIPIVDIAIDPVTACLTRSAVVLSLLAYVDTATGRWTRHRAIWSIVLLVVGVFAGGPPAGLHLGGWLAGGAVTALALLAAYVTVVRADLTMIPIALATMLALSVLARGGQRAFPGAVAGATIAILVIAAVGWWMFAALRRTRQEALTSPPEPLTSG
jgi:hypothetical protein